MSSELTVTAQVPRFGGASRDWSFPQDPADRWPEWDEPFHTPREEHNQ